MTFGKDPNEHTTGLFLLLGAKVEFKRMLI